MDPEPREAPLPSTTFDAIEHPKKRGYLLALAMTGVQLRACQATGISRTTVWVWRQDDPRFVALEAEAKKLGAETLVAEAYRRAVEGWEEPVFYKGLRVDTVRKWSDVLLMFQLKALLPDIYRERYEVSGDRTRPLTVQIIQEGD